MLAGVGGLLAGDAAGWPCRLSLAQRSVSLRRAERATVVLLADPCFQLRSIQYLLGHAEPSALAPAAPATDKRHFSLHTCKCWHCAGPSPWPQLGSASPAVYPSPLSPGDRGLWLPRRPPPVVLGMGLCPVPTFGSGFVPSLHPMSSLLSPPCGSLSPAWGSPSWLVPEGSCRPPLPAQHPAALGQPKGPIHPHAHPVCPHRHGVYQYGGAGEGGQDAEPPERGVQAGGCHHAGECPPTFPSQVPHLAAASVPSPAALGHSVFIATANCLVPPQQPTSEEDLCPICYAHPISAVFRPCSHKSCK